VAHQVLKTLKARPVSVLDPKRIQMFFGHEYVSLDQYKTKATNFTIVRKEIRLCRAREIRG
jgi:hypothetical protein